MSKRRIKRENEKATKVIDGLILQFLTCFQKCGLKENEITAAIYSDLERKWITYCRKNKYQKTAEGLFQKSIEHVLKLIKNESQKTIQEIQPTTMNGHTAESEAEKIPSPETLTEVVAAPPQLTYKETILKQESHLEVLR